MRLARTVSSNGWLSTGLVVSLAACSSEDAKGTSNDAGVAAAVSGGAGRSASGGTTSGGAAGGVTGGAAGNVTGGATGSGRQFHLTNVYNRANGAGPIDNFGVGQFTSSNSAFSRDYRNVRVSYDGWPP